MGYDVKCLELAEAFLEDEPPALRVHAPMIAQAIQDTVESELEELHESESLGSPAEHKEQK